MSNSAAHPWFHAYIAARGNELRKASHRVYGAWWKRFVDFLDDRGRTPAGASEADARAFFGNYSGNTVIRYCRLLTAVYDAALQAGLCSSNPLAGLEVEYANKEEERVDVPAPTGNLVEALYAVKPKRSHWKQYRDRALVLLAAETGLRRQELIDLELGDVNLSAVPSSVTGRAPGKKRDVALSAGIRQELENWLELRRTQGLKGQLVFPAKPEGDKLDPSTVYRIIERHLAQVGAGKKGAHSKSGAHLLRAGVANRAMEQGAPLAEVQKLLGHRLPTSTVDLVTRLEPIEVSKE